MRQQLLAANEVGDLIEDAVTTKRAFCFVRLGDGEGNLLNFRHPAEDEDRRYFEHHFGIGSPLETVMKIRDNLIAAICAADLIGVRDDVWLAPYSVKSLGEDDVDFLARFRSEFPLRGADRGIDVNGAKRIFRLYRWSSLSFPTGTAACSAWVCYDLAILGFWERLIVESGSVGLIHCSPELPEKINRELGVEVEAILVPDQVSQRSQWERQSSPLPQLAHYPDVYLNVCNLLSRPLDGKIFLVGAGLVGKKYLKVIKDNGGVGVDVGALLDAWDGRATRKTVYQDKLGREYITEAVPPVFQLDRARVGSL